MIWRCSAFFALIITLLQHVQCSTSPSEDFEDVAQSDFMMGDEQSDVVDRHWTDAGAQFIYSPSITGFLGEDPKRSHFVSMWPNKHKSLSDMGEYQVQVSAGPLLLEQFLSTRVVHMVLDKIVGRRLPIEMLSLPLIPKQYSEIEDTFGTLYLEISNIRLHKVRITGYRGTDPSFEVVEDDDGGHFEKPLKKKRWWHWLWPFGKNKDGKKEKKTKGQDSSSSSSSDEWTNIYQSPERNQQFKEDEARPLVFFSEQGGIPHIRTVIKGLNAMLQADYTIRALKSGAEEDGDDVNRILYRGNLLVRAVDSVLLLQTRTARFKDDGVPILRVGPDHPQFRFGRVDVWYDGNKFDWFARVISKVVLKFGRQMIAKRIGNSLVEELPRISALIFKNMEYTVRKSLDKLLLSKGIPQPEFPHIIIQDLRWWIKNKRLHIGANLKHIIEDEQERLKRAVEESLSASRRQGGQWFEQEAVHRAMVKLMTERHILNRTAASEAAVAA